MRSASAVVCALAVVAATVGCGAHGARPRERGSSSRPVVVRAAPPLRSVGARVQARIPTGVTAVCSIVAAGGRVWVSAPEEGQVIAIDPHTDRVVARKRLPGKACLMRSAGGCCGWTCARGW